MLRKRKSPVAKTLVKNGCAAMMAAIEIHNKPVFEYRYEVCTMLVINAWESVFKAVIYKHWKSELFEKNPKKKQDYAKQLLPCLQILTNKWGKDFLPVKESVEQLYGYRNQVAHFHSEPLDGLLFSLLRANVAFFVEFVKEKCDVDLCKGNFVILPIGLSPDFNVVEFLVKQPTDMYASREVRDFINDLIDSCRRLQEAGIKDGIFSLWNVHLAGVKHAKNADIIAAVDNRSKDTSVVKVFTALSGEFNITDSPNAQRISIDDSDFFAVYTESYKDVYDKSKEKFSDFRQDKKFLNLMKTIKANKNLCGVRCLGADGKGAKRELYSKAIYEELAKHYTPKEAGENSGA